MNLVEEKRKKQLSIPNKQKMCKLAKKAKNLKLKKCSSQNTQDNIVKELKLNVNHNIKIGRNHNLL